MVSALYIKKLLLFIHRNDELEMPKNWNDGYEIF